MTVTGQPVLKLIATRRSALRRNLINLTFRKLTQNWAADSTANITDANLVPVAINDVTVGDSVYAAVIPSA